MHTCLLVGRPNHPLASLRGRSLRGRGRPAPMLAPPSAPPSAPAAPPGRSRCQSRCRSHPGPPGRSRRGPSWPAGRRAGRPARRPASTSSRPRAAGRRACPAARPPARAASRPGGRAGSPGLAQARRGAERTLPAPEPGEPGRAGSSGAENLQKFFGRNSCFFSRGEGTSNLS